LISSPQAIGTGARAVIKAQFRGLAYPPLTGNVEISIKIILLIVVAAAKHLPGGAGRIDVFLTETEDRTAPTLKIGVVRLFFIS